MREIEYTWGKRFMRHSLLFAAVLSFGLLAASCGSDDDSASPADGSSAEPGGSSGSEATAVVTVGSSTYDLAAPLGCTLLGGNDVLVTLENADDTVSLTAADGVVLVRMTLDGVDWVDSGGPPDPEISESQVTWSGQVATFPNGGASPEDATIDITC